MGMSMILIILLAAILAPNLAPNDPNGIDIYHIFAEPNSQYPLGTDEMGRCILSRLLYGAANSMSIAVPTLIVLAVSSTALAVVCSYAGGLVDKVFGIVCNIFMAFPPILVAVTLVGSLGQGYWSIVISLLFSLWVWYARVIRTYVLQEKNKDYIVACRISGCSNSKILIRHIFPNILPHLIVYFSTGIASIILTISIFAFLGLGFATGTAEWGSMFSNAANYLQSHPLLLLYPGLCIIFAAAGFNLFGEALRDILSRENA
jgi:peptide/nickel transport system permease protein